MPAKKTLTVDPKSQAAKKPTQNAKKSAGGGRRKPAAGRTAPQRHKGGNVDPKLLEMLVCPVSKEALVYDKAAGELISEKAGLAYPIYDGIPMLVTEDARRLPKK